VIGDEYEAWQRDRESTDNGVRDPLACCASKQDRYPRLSRMAMDFMTIQPMQQSVRESFRQLGGWYHLRELV
jgi:hypothetical protein